MFDNAQNQGILSRPFRDDFSFIFSWVQYLGPPVPFQYLYNKALLYMGRMNQQDLQRVASNQQVDQQVRDLATKVASNEAQMQGLRRLAKAEQAMEQQNSSATRREASQQALQDSETVQISEEESSAASTDLNDLFSMD